MTTPERGLPCCGAKGSVLAIGSRTAQVMVIGIGPGAQEMDQGEPFVGPSGNLLNTLIRGAGFQREDFFLTNLVCTWPPDNTPTPEMLDACLPRLRAEIEMVRPKLIIPMGAIAAEIVTGCPDFALGKNKKFSVSKLRGQPLWYDNVMGTDHSCRIMPTWHPAAFLHDGGADYILDLCRDFQKLMPYPQVDVLSWQRDYGAWTWALVDAPFTDKFFTIPGRCGWELDPAYPVSIDIETGNAEQAEELTMDVFQEGLLCFGIAQTTPAGTHAIVFTPPAYASFVEWFKRYGGDYTWLMQYGFFDRQGLRRHLNIDVVIGRDTLSGSYALDERQGVHSLKTNAREYTGAHFWEKPVLDALHEWRRKAELLALSAEPLSFTQDGSVAWEGTLLITGEEMCATERSLFKRTGSIKARHKERPNLYDFADLLDGDLADRFKGLACHRTRRSMDTADVATYEERLSKIKSTGFEVVPLPILTRYNAEDAARTAQLDATQQPRMEEDNVLPLYNDILIPDMNCNADITYRGIYIDERRVDKLLVEWGPLWQGMHDKLQLDAEAYGFINDDGSLLNLSSPKQKSRFVYDVIQVTPPESKKLTTKTGARSTNVKLLDQVKGQHDWLEAYVRWVHLDHNLGAYVLPMHGYLRDDRRIHAQWKPHAARTGRDAYAAPPLHQMPKYVDTDSDVISWWITNYGIAPNAIDLREAFTVEDTDEYCFVEADYERGEGYVAAFVSGDQNLLDDLRTADWHKTVAAKRLFKIDESLVTDKMRRDAKYVNFGMMFGMEADSMAKEHLHCPVWEAKKFIRDWWAGYHDFYRYTQERKREAMETGEIFVPWTHRKRRFKLILGESSFHELNQAVNMPIQGTLSDYQKKARLALHRELPQYDSAILLTLHDMIAFEVKKVHLSAVCQLIWDFMTKDWFGLGRIPVEIKAGPTWGSTKKMALNDAGQWVPVTKGK